MPEVWQIVDEKRIRQPYVEEVIIVAKDIGKVFEKYPYAISIEHIGYFGGEL